MSNKKELRDATEVCVVISYSFDPTVSVIICDDYESACEFIAEDFEKEKNIDINENNYEIDEEKTFLGDDHATLATKYNSGIGITKWQVANTYDKR